MNEPLKKFVHGLVILPHAVEQAVEGALVGARWGRLDSHLHCVQRISSQHSSRSWGKIDFLSLLFVYAHVASNVPTSHTTSHKFKSHCWCLKSVRFVVDLSVLFKVKFDFYWFQNLIVWVSDPFVLWFSPSGTTWLLDWKTPTGGSLNIRRGRRRTWLGTRISTARPRPRRARRREREYVGLKKQPFVCSNANALHELWVQSKIKSRCLHLTLSLLWIC